MGIGSLLSGASNLGSGIAGLVFGRENLDMQKENQQYLRNLQKTIFQREDNSVQRRAHDLEASGLSKTLAAGGGAGAGALIKTDAPQMNDNGGLEKIAKSPMAVMEAMQMKKNIAQTQANIDYTKAQENKVSVETQNARNTGNLQKIKLMYEEAFSERNLAVLTSQRNIQKLKEEEQSLNNQLASRNIKTKDLDLLIRELDKNLKTKNLSMYDKELIAKQQAIDLGKHNLDIWKKLGLPSNTTLNKWLQGGVLLENKLQNNAPQGAKDHELPLMN